MATAIKGDNPDVSAKVPKTRSKNTKTNPMTIPNAKFTPIPPLRFTDETATPMIVKIKAVTISPQRRYFTNK